MSNNLLEKYSRDPELMDKLQAFLVDPEKNEKLLPPKLVEKLNRLNAADSLIRKLGTREKVVERLRILYPELSDHSLFLDYRDAKAFFGSQSFKQKGYDRQMWYDWCIEMAQKAKAANDCKGFNQAAQMAYKFGQFYLEDDDANPIVNLEPHTIILTNDPSILGIEKVTNLEEKKKLLFKKLKKKENAWDDLTEDVEPNE